MIPQLTVIVIMLLALCIVCLSNAILDISKQIHTQNVLLSEIKSCLKDRNTMSTFIGREINDSLKGITDAIRESRDDN